MLILSLVSQKHFKNLEWFYTHSIIRQFAISMFGIFNSIYVFQVLIEHKLGNNLSLALTSLFFAVVYLSQYFSIRLAIIAINKVGLRKCMLIGGILTTLFFFTLYLGKFNLLFFILSAILGGTYLGFYYIAFHIYFTELTDDKAEGEEVAIGSVLPAIVSILGPMFAGFLIRLTGFGGVFLAMGVALISANIPLKFIPNTKDGVKLEIPSFFSVFRSKKNFNNNLALSGFAVMEVTTSYFWPLFVFPLLKNSFVELGFIGSLIALISTITTFLVGFLIDKLSAKKMIKILSFGDCIIWIARIFIHSPVQAFTSSAVQALTSQGQNLSLDTMVYKNSRSEKDMTPILQREVNFALTRFIFLFSIGILFLFGVPLITSFILAAFATLFTSLYKG